MDHRTLPRRAAVTAVLLGAFLYTGAGSRVRAQQAPSSAGEGNPASTTRPAAVAGGTARAMAVFAASGAPVVDGDLSDPAWSGAPVYEGFLQRNPVEGAPASQRTTFQVVYTAAALFVAVRAYDADPDRIAAVLARRDDETPSDEISIMLDSYRDRRTGYLFAVNAAGVQRDAYLYDDNRRDERWDAVWDGAARIDAEGWVAEFRIPLSQLRFAGSEISGFGFNVSRTIARLNEEQYWRLAPKTSSGVVSLFGDLAGLADIAPPRRLELLPYTVARLSRSPASRPGGATSAAATMGGDLRVGVTSALALTATVNPDFGQVEADPAQVNLSAFESFFPERRPFFTEGLDLFQFPVAAGQRWGGAEGLFYSRRIGRSPQGRADRRGGYAEEIANTTILGAAKLTGKTPSGWTVGLLTALTDRETATVVDSVGRVYGDEVEPRTAYAIARVARDFRNGRTVVGAFGTGARRQLPDRLTDLRSAAYTGGADLVHRFGNDTYRIEARVLGSHVVGSAAAIARTQRSSARYYQRPDRSDDLYDTTRTSLSGYAMAVSAEKEAGAWRWQTGLERRSPGLELNDVGYLRQADRTYQWLTVSRYWFEPGPVFRFLRVRAAQRAFWTHRWERRDLSGEADARFTLRNYWTGSLGIDYALGGISPETLRGGPAISRPGETAVSLSLGTDDRRRIRAGVGGRLAFEHENPSSRRRVNANVTWRPTDGIELRAEPRVTWNRDTWQYLGTHTYQDQPLYLLGDLEQRTTSMELRASVTFSPRLSLQAYVEPFISTGRYRGYSRVVDPRADGFGSQFETLPASRISASGGNVALDLDADGAGDVSFGAPDFTVLSFRSNLVLRWEYGLGSTLFLVWQQGRTDRLDQGRFDFRANVGDLFDAPAEHVFLIKVNYWINP